jgi:hypothetical protein
MVREKDDVVVDDMLLSVISPWPAWWVAPAT